MHNLTERGPPPASSNPASDQRSLVESATDAIFTIRMNAAVAWLPSIRVSLVALVVLVIATWIVSPHPAAQTGFTEADLTLL